MVVSWKTIGMNTYCYYMEPIQGKRCSVMYAGRVTPDGCITDASGAWTLNGSPAEVSEKRISTKLNDEGSGQDDGTTSSGRGYYSGNFINEGSDLELPDADVPNNIFEKLGISDWARTS